MALSGHSLGPSGGDHPNNELASPGVKALVVAISHLCPRPEIIGVAYHTGLLEAPGKPVHLLNPPQKPDHSCPTLDSFQGQGPGGSFPESPGQWPGL